MLFIIVCGMVVVSYKIFLSVWTFLELRILKRFPLFCYCDIYERPVYGVFMFYLCGIICIYR